MTRNLLNNNAYSYPTTQSLKRIILEDGTAAAPSIDSVNNPGNGYYYESNGNISFSTGSTKRLRIGTTEVQIDVPQYSANGTAAAPSRAFTNDTTSGMYLDSVGVPAISAAGNKITSYSATNVTHSQPVLLPNGTTANCALAFANEVNTGISHSGSTLQLNSAGTNALNVSAGAVTALLPFVAPVGSVTNCGFQFTGDPNCGIYHIAADKLGFAAGGNLLATIGNFQGFAKAIGFNSGMFFQTSSISSTPYSIADGDCFLNATTGSSVFTMPTGLLYDGRIICIVNTKGSSITINVGAVGDQFCKAGAQSTSLTVTNNSAVLMFGTTTPNNFWFVVNT